MGPGGGAVVGARGIAGTIVDLGMGLEVGSVCRVVPAVILMPEGRDTEISVDFAGGWVEAAAGSGGTGAGSRLMVVCRDTSLMILLVRAMGAKAGKCKRGKGLGIRWWIPKKYPTGTVTFLSVELKKNVVEVDRGLRCVHVRRTASYPFESREKKRTYV